MVEMLLCAIKHGKSGFVKWAIQKNPMTINELLNQGYFDNAIYRAITRENLKYLELVYEKIVPFEITLDHLRVALRCGIIKVLKFLIQKKTGMEISDDEKLIEYLKTKQDLFDDFVSKAWSLGIVSSGNIAIVEYLMEKFSELKLQQYINTW